MQAEDTAAMDCRISISISSLTQSKTISLLQRDRARQNRQKQQHIPHHLPPFPVDGHDKLSCDTLRDTRTEIPHRAERIEQRLTFRENLAIDYREGSFESWFVASDDEECRDLEEECQLETIDGRKERTLIREVCRKTSISRKSGGTRMLGETGRSGVVSEAKEMAAD